ncbi:MAG: type II and III secretion system protein [Verrucomicrobiota bacterium]|nr:type II and III secretion system protein [Verrucomicrobiota bacterium]
MKNFICCIIFIFTVFAHFSYAQQTSVIDVINQSEIIEKKVVNESPSYSLMDKAINLYKEGKYSDSEKTFEFILQQDPYNRKAMEYLQRIATRVSVISEVEQQSARAQALAEIGQSWKESSKVYSIETEEDKKPIISSDDIAIQDLIESMQSIRIEKCEFINEEISVVLSFLAFKTREGSGKSVNFVPYGMSDLIGGETLINIELTDPSIFEALTFITEMNNWKFEVRSNAVIVMPIDYVAAEDLKVVTYPILPEVGAELEMSSSDSSPDDLFGDFSSNDNAGGPIDVQNHFAIVDWPEGSRILYHPSHSRLQVKNTAKNIKTLELILNDMREDAIQKRTRQVQIETKFVEYNEGALEELGYDWTLYDSGSVADFELADSGNYYTRGGTYNSSPVVTGPGGEQLYNTDGSAGVFGAQVIPSTAGPGGQQGQSLFGTALRSNSQGLQQAASGSLLSLMGGTPAALVLENYNDIPLDLAITAMEQEGTADVLNAPKVTTKSGNEAVIKVVETHRYPLDYDVETGQRTAPVVKPQDWEDKDLGVVLKVEPTVDVENETIELELNPEITKFVGYDEYIVGVNSYETGGNNASTFVGDGRTLIAKVPYFKTRSISTQVTISDGSTVVMGGLVDEQTDTFRDQVPLLGDIPYFGRFFRSEGSRNFKRNLLITVKATQVDDRGMTKEERELERKSNSYN